MQAVRHEPGHRLNVLLTEAEHRWSDQLPRLLEPQGVRAIRVGDVDEAVSVIESEPIHAVVVDVGLPMDRTTVADVTPGGLKLLRVIHRMDPAPPTVVVRGRRFDRLDDRLLGEALKLDAFSVMDEPVDLEQMLETLRRLFVRYYGGSWPGEADRH
jgi:DNA-binding response OmpR family regulator